MLEAAIAFVLHPAIQIVDLFERNNLHRGNHDLPRDASSWNNRGEETQKRTGPIAKDHPENTTNPEAHQSFPRVYIFRAPVCMNMVSSLGTIASGRIPKVFFAVSSFPVAFFPTIIEVSVSQDELIDQPPLRKSRKVTKNRPSASPRSTSRSLGLGKPAEKRAPVMELFAEALEHINRCVNRRDCYRRSYAELVDR
jgi:hypothetical protein